ncbi:MAG: flagellar biosynthesis protein FlhA [Syntrophobacteraceae bacterium]|nr:flagellar biosynthesis protein FlhA [Syntrophobacteraceae bacterium]
MNTVATTPNPLLQRLKNVSDGDAVLGIGIVMILSIMLLPLPSMLLDVLIAANISVALVILLTAIYSIRAVDFAIFPSILLITTLFRLALNVSCTRLVLLHGHEGTAAAGHIIEAFGNFIVGGNYVVGLVMFIILVIVNFIVITKGTERISEVAARFTLDAMPGKQMSIDADLNTGMINEQEARRRREDIAQEADFYGTMDGASKFVRGDAIAGILITFINIIGGLLIGVLQNGMSLLDALKNYTLLTVGDGLVSQIPALVISTSAGILVSKAASDSGMGKAFGKVFRMQPKPLGIAGLLLYVLILVPGFPFLPLMTVGTLLVSVSHYLSKRETVEETMSADGPQTASDQSGESAKLPPLMEALELEVGYGLIALVDEGQNGDLLSRIKAIRQQLALDFGIIVPALHIRDNLQLKPAEYRVLLKGNPIGRAELMLGHYLALSPGENAAPIEGIVTKDPAFGLSALWISESRTEAASAAGYTVIDLSTVMATHLTELFKQHAAELLDRQTVQQLLDHLAEVQPKLIEELTPGMLSVGAIQKILQNLISEQIPVRDLQTIAETLADQASATKDPEILTEYVRQALARTVTRPFETPDGKLHILTLQQSLEEHLIRSVQKTDQGSFLSLEPNFLHQFIQSVSAETKRVLNLGHHPVILCSPMLRRHVRRLLERFMPEVVVIAHSELKNTLEIQAMGVIRVSHAD